MQRGELMVTAAVVSAVEELRPLTGWRDRAVPVAASFLVLTASLVNFVQYHSYPLFRPEVAIMVAGLALVATLFGLVHAVSSQFGRALLEGFLVYVAVDLNSDHVLVAAIAAAIVAFARLGRNFSALPVIGIVASAVLASGLLGLAQRREPIATVGAATPEPSQRQAILHLILDEHGGPAGAADAGFRQELTDFYAKRGFRLFDHAYSRHFHTVNAIPDVLNFGHPGESRNVSETLDIGRTDYLSGLKQRGFRLNFYQSDFADFCRYTPYASCTSYWSPSLAFLADEPLSAGEKARLMALKFVALSSLAVTVAGSIDIATHLPLTQPLDIGVMAPSLRAASGSLGGFAILDRMTADMRSAKPGNVYFAHVLAPHFPYGVDRRCAVREPSQWHYRRSSLAIEARQAAYREQVRCLLTKLDRMIRAFESSAAGRNGVIVIHGDHGSRITGVEPVNGNRSRVTSADLMAGYSTLFAVRAAGIAAGVDPVPYPTPAILQRLTSSQFQSVDGLQPGSGQVFLDDHGWTVGEPISIAKAWPVTN